MTKAYKTLIKQLLYCDEGEEWDVLQQHPKLLTPYLLKVMLEEVNQLKWNKKQKEADWLSDFAKLFEQWLKIMQDRTRKSFQKSQ